MTSLQSDLARYVEYWGSNKTSEQYERFVNSTPDCCLRTHLAGHCTGSALIVCPRGERVLLLFHPFLKRWLLPGGHADGNTDLLQVARREAHEETGLPLERLHPVALDEQGRTPLDLDIHPIPARKGEPAHFHYDLRFLLTADPALPLYPESPDLRVEWLPLSDVEQRTREESVLRMVRKVQNLRSEGKSLTLVDWSLFL